MAYESKLLEAWRTNNVFHPSLLRLFRVFTQTPSTTAAKSNKIKPKDDQPYDVEKLLRWCWRGPSHKKVKEFLVLWTGWSIDDASWVPEGNFDYPNELKKMIARDKPVEDQK